MSMLLWVKAVICSVQCATSRQLMAKVACVEEEAEEDVDSGVDSGDSDGDDRT